MKRRVFLFGFAVIFLIGAGCVGPSRLEMDYGTSFNLIKFNQILHSEAEKNLEPVMELDGVSAQGSMEKYRKEFEKPSEMGYTPLAIGTILGVGKK